MQLSIQKNTLIPLALIAALCSAAFAQEAPPPSIPVSYAYDTGWVENRSSRPIVTISFTVYQAQAEWMRLYFQDVHLGRNPQVPGQGSILRITAFKDGAVQEMNTTHVDQWKKSSAYFNGDSVQVEVLADPGTRSRLVMRALDMGLAPADDPPATGCRTPPPGCRLTPGPQGIHREGPQGSGCGGAGNALFVLEQLESVHGPVDGVHALGVRPLGR